MQATPLRFNGHSQPTALPGGDRAGFHLRFRSLFREGHGYSFPCDASGKVDMDRLSERARINYLFARALVGRDLQVPEVLSAPQHGWEH